MPDDATLPAVYRRPPAEMSERTWRWCCDRWPGFADARRAQRASDAYLKPQSAAVRKLMEIEV